jgi:hypothetical protein
VPLQSVVAAIAAIAVVAFAAVVTIVAAAAVVIRELDIDRNGGRRCRDGGKAEFRRFDCDRAGVAAIARPEAAVSNPAASGSASS